MNVVFVNTINEIQKMFSKKKNIVLLILTFLITFSISIINLISKNIIGGLLLKNSSLPITVLDFCTLLIIPIIVFMITSDSFSGEHSNGSINLLLVRPISRHKIYISKILSVSIFISIMLFIMFLTSTILSIFSGSASEIFSNLPSNLITYCAAIVPLTMLAIITSFVAQFFKSSSGTIVIMTLGLIILSSLKPILSSYSIVFPTKYINWYQNFSYSEFNFQLILNELMFIVSFMILSLSTGFYLFSTRDN